MEPPTATAVQDSGQSAGVSALPERMLAHRLTAWGAPPSWATVPVPRPGPGQVLVRVLAVGLCHSDLHVVDARPGVMAFEPPFTLGHEVAGEVAAVGAGVVAWRPGDRVAVHGVWGCGRCRHCLNGRENYCLDRGPAVGGGLGADGGLAAYQLVPAERFLVAADGLPPAVVAPLTDAGLTSYHAVTRSLPRLHPGATAVVIGVGGLGHLAIQLLRASGAVTVVAVDTRQSARDLARRHGAVEVSAGGDDAVATLRRLGGADLVLDFVGAPATVALGVAVLRADGELTVVGGAGGELVVGKHVGLPPGVRVSLPFWGTRAELHAVLELARHGRLQPEVTTFAASDVEAAYSAMRAGAVLGRAVVEGLDSVLELN